DVLLERAGTHGGPGPVEGGEIGAVRAADQRRRRRFQPVIGELPLAVGFFEKAGGGPGGGTLLRLLLEGLQRRLAVEVLGPAGGVLEDLDVVVLERDAKGQDQESGSHALFLSEAGFVDNDTPGRRPICI